MDENFIKNTIEALLLTAQAPLSLQRIRRCFNSDKYPDLALIQRAIHTLQQEFQSRSIELISIDGRYSIQTRIEYRDAIQKLQDEKPPRYSKALLETLAIIAYKQPVTRADIEDIRGVATSSTIIKTLLEREWIKVAGHRDVPGKPVIFVTTREFLQYFNLRDLQSLPEISSFKEDLTV
jgi:segregation and condensation protein B